jgi:glycosyltransferase involved in cell wall biosynthesis
VSLGSTIKSERPIRVGIDGRELRLPYTGIGRYVTELCKVLDKLLPRALFFIYSNRPIRMPVDSPRWAARTDPLIGVSHLYSLMWFMLRAGSLCEPDRIDVFWGTATILPRLPASIRKVVTVHDLFHMDRKLVPLKRWLSYGLLYKRSLADAHSIVANSETTAWKLHSLLGYEAADIARPGVSERYRPHPPEQIEACLQLYGIKKPYIFAVASAYEPRKNLGSLLEAFCGMNTDGVLRDRTLVLAGMGGARAVAASPSARTAEPSTIRSLGQVPDDHLVLLYCGAEVFVFPSTHEGFGIPVLEARSCGTTVVATDIPELREAGGNDAIYVMPTVEGVRAGITRALVQQTRDGRPIAKAHGWEESAAVVARLLFDPGSTSY